MFHVASKESIVLSKVRRLRTRPDLDPNTNSANTNSLQKQIQNVKILLPFFNNFQLQFSILSVCLNSILSDASYSPKVVAYD